MSAGNTDIASADEAVAACRHLVEQSLAEHYKLGMTAGQLYAQYTSFGDDPFVIARTVARRSASRLDASERAEAMCTQALARPHRHAPAAPIRLLPLDRAPADVVAEEAARPVDLADSRVGLACASATVLPLAVTFSTLPPLATSLPSLSAVPA